MRNNILFLLIDCLRADKILGRETPFIDYLSRNGVSFTQAISATSFTTPCVASILTGVYPFTHGIEWFSANKLNPQCVTLAELLRKNGYTTCAMVTGPLDPQLGLDRGFDNYLYRNEDENIYSGFKGQLESHLEKMKRPWFLFLHLWELHYPIYLPKHLEMKYSLSLDKYDKAFTCLDHQLATILKKLDFNETIVILHADHGERLPSSLESIQRNLLAYLKKGLINDAVWFRLSKKLFQWFPNLRKKQGHGYHLYDPLIRVPLIFAGNGFPKNRIIKKQVSQIDILPTIVDALELKDLNIEVQGRSLLPLINKEDTLERAVYIGPGGIRDIWPPRKDEWLEGLRTAKWKYISAYNKEKPVELYDLENDPKELNNLVNIRKEITQRFKEELREIKLSRPKVHLRMTQKEEEKIKKRLRHLGYI